MQIEFTEEELMAIQRIVDAALRGAGIAILQESHWLQVKLKTAFDEVQKQKIEPVLQK